jgi:branched-chain amino acid transport system ATP-binding protein
MTLLSVEHVGVRFGGLVAIADLHFGVKEGEIVSLIGPNGAGKTTAFNVVTGFLKPSQGRVSFRGTPLTGLKPHQITRLGLARTFQRTSVFPDDTVRDNVLIGLHGKAASERASRDTAAAILELVGLTARANEKAGTLAYGEQRLVGVALALATEPTMLLLDEPVSGMNESETRTVVDLLRGIRQRGITILLVEHDMRMVMEVSDRILVLNYGRLIAEGTPDAIRADPAVIEAYLGQGSAARQAGQAAANA